MVDPEVHRLMKFPSISQGINFHQTIRKLPQYQLGIQFQNMYFTVVSSLTKFSNVCASLTVVNEITTTTKIQHPGFLM